MMTGGLPFVGRSHKAVPSPPGELDGPGCKRFATPVESDQITSMDGAQVPIQVEDSQHQDVEEILTDTQIEVDSPPKVYAADTQIEESQLGLPKSEGDGLAAQPQESEPRDEVIKKEVEDNMVKEEEEEDSIPASQLDLYKDAMEASETMYEPEEYERILKAKTMRWGEEEEEEEAACEASPELPAVTREEQQAFKDKNNKVKQSDGHPEYVSKPRAKTAEQGKKRPPAQPKKSPKKKAKKESERVQRVVEETPEECEPGEDIKKDLSEDFEAEVDSEKPKRAQRKAKGEAKAKAKAKAAAKAPAKAKPSAKASAKASGTPKGKVAEKAKSVHRGKKKDAARNQNSKATFAGRRPPATEEALWRYNAMKTAFDECLADTLTISVGMAEDHVFSIKCLLNQVLKTCKLLPCFVGAPKPRSTHGGTGPSRASALSRMRLSRST